MEKFAEVTSDFDAEGKRLTGDDIEKRLKQLQEGDFTEEMKKEKGKMSYMLDEEAGGSFATKSVKKKQEALNAVIKKKLAGAKGIKEGDLDQGDETDAEYRDRLKTLALEAKDEKGKDVFSEAGKEVIEEGVTKTASEWGEEIFNAISEWFKNPTVKQG